jgi:hypothetical protein
MRGALLIALMLALVPAGRADADDSAIQGVGGAIQLMDEHPSVVMEQMQAAIHLSPDRGRVDCLLVFHNTGPRTSVRMGFPEEGTDEGRPLHGRVGFTTFATWVDGRRVPTAIEGETSSAGSWERWRVKTVQFSTAQRRRVRVRYSARTGDDISGRHYFAYRTGSGASWKGPIGRARISLQVSYDRARWQLSVPAGFRQLSQGRYEFARRGYEPSARDEVIISFLPVFYAVGSDGGGGQSAPSVFGGQTAGGMAIFVPVRDLARWLGAELAYSRPAATLTLGRHEVTARPGESRMQVGGQRVPLTAAPVVEDDRMFVPLRPVAAALGVPVTYLAARRTALLSLSLGKALSEVLAKDQLDRLFGYSPRNSTLMGFAPPQDHRYLPEALQFASRQSLPRPWLAARDFDGDHAVEVALFLEKRDTRGLALLEVDPSEDPRLMLLTTEPNRGPIAVVLRSRPPGSVEYWQEGEAAPKLARFDLKHDGFEVIAVGKATTLFYWDARLAAYQHVTTAD